MSEVNKSKVRINLYLPTQLVDRIDEYAELNGFNRTTSIHVLLTNSINQLDAQKAISQVEPLKNILEKLKETQMAAQKNE